MKPGKGRGLKGDRKRSEGGNGERGGWIEVHVEES